MIRHIVIFQFDETKTTEAELLSIKSDLENLVNIVPELNKMEVGINVNTNEQQDLVLTADVQDLAALEAYAKHPAHLEVAQRIGAIKTGRMCVDYNF